MPREGSFALAFFGRVRKVQEPRLRVGVAAGWRSFALKRILEMVTEVDFNKMGQIVKRRTRL
jgi:hypothetical protein